MERKPQMTPANPGATAGARSGQTERKRQRYEAPQIVDRGRLVEVALGGSPGTGDTGGGFQIEERP